MRRRGVRSAACAAVLVAAACGADERLLTPCRVPVITDSRVSANATSVLSAIVTASLTDADSVLVRYGPQASPRDGATPAQRVAGPQVVVPVLGLTPETVLEVQLVAFNFCGAAEGPALAFTTGALPSDLPTYVAGGDAPSPGYVAFAAGNYGLVIDNSGRVVWYRRFSSGPGLNFQPQPNGHYVARPPAGDPAAPWVEIDVLGDVTRTLGCAGGLAARFHDIVVKPAGDYWVLCDDVREMDLSSLGGRSDAKVTGTGVQHIGVGGELLFAWSPFDHLEIADLDASERTGANVNWTHGNAIDLADDGNVLVSFRNLSQIVKIDSHTGAVLWRLGGAHNDFTLENASTPPFFRQHGVRLAGAGQLVLLDNLGEASGSRGERYELDEARHVARLVGVYEPDRLVLAQVGGTTQPLAGGKTLVSFGSGGRVEEYDASGRSLWRIQGDPGYVFRAQRINSLYTPGVGTSR